MTRGPRVLVFTRQYPNAVLPRQGLWVQHQTRAIARHVPCVVVAPTPFCPPGPLPEAFAKFRDIPRHEVDGAVVVHHPRFLSGPGLSTYAAEATAMALGARSLVDGLWRSPGFDVIHAHFTYPDGAAAARLARRYGVPVVMTEHTLWQSWLARRPLVKRQAVAAARRAAYHVGVSEAVRRQLVEVTGRDDASRVVHIGVDGGLFTPALAPRPPGGADVLFVGWINYVKGIDVLLRAMATLLERLPQARLTLVGGALFRDKQRQEDELRALATSLGLDEAVRFVGPQPVEGIADWMRRSDVLVLPSRRESCGAVLLEALACGIPVIATRCGGPADIVTDAVGRLVPPEDPRALASSIADVLHERSTFDPQVLRAHALDGFSWDYLASQYLDLFERSVGPQRGATRTPPRGVRAKGGTA